MVLRVSGLHLAVVEGARQFHPWGWNQGTMHTKRAPLTSAISLPPAHLKQWGGALITMLEAMQSSESSPWSCSYRRELSALGPGLPHGLLLARCSGPQLPLYHRMGRSALFSGDLTTDLSVSCSSES